jgi:hypothetical protein
MLDEAPGACAAGGDGSIRPGSSGGGGALVIVGVILLLGAAGAVLWFVTRKPPEPPKVTTVETVSASQTESTIELPAIDPALVDSGVDTGDDGGAEAGKKVVAGEACTATCTGQITDALKQAVAARAGTAKQCYKTALEGNEGLAGDMSVLVRVGTNGSTCSVSVTSDTTGSMRLQQCVRGKMAASYPLPRGGCVDVRVPISFKPKT